MFGFLETARNLIVAATAIVSSLSPASQPQNLELPQTGPKTIQETKQTNLENYYSIGGSYEYLGKSVTYEAFIPKNGGEITGNVSGDCSGAISGTYTKPSKEISGSGFTECQVLFLKKKLEASFTGNIDEKNKSTNVDWQGLGDISQYKGSLTLPLN